MAYQGWKNWATLNVALWFSNDRRLYDVVREHRKFTAASAKEFVIDLLPNGTPDMKDKSPSEIHALYASVSWSEIARDFNELRGG